MNDHHYLSHQFLIAMPGLQDPNFFQTVIYVCEHNEKGAMGLVLNKPTQYNLGELFNQMNLECRNPLLAQKPLLIGGPVQTAQGFILHRPLGSWEASMPITDTMTMTSSNDILDALANGQGPEDVLVALGYAGWGPNQLEQELADNAWLNMPADADLIFKTEPVQLLQAAASLLGIDFSRMSSEAGHA